MTAPLTPTPSSQSRNDLEYQKFRADGNSGYSVSVVNPDGSTISGGGGGGGTSSNFGSANPTAGTAAGFSDGTNMQEARVYDTDSGAGTENTIGVSLRKSASGGSVELGTNTNPVRTDPTGTTTQPVNNAQVSGTVVSVNNGTTDAGTQRVTLSSDSTGQVKLAASSATNIGNVGSISATGSAVPANAFYVSGINSSGNLTGLVTYDRANDGATGSGILASGAYMYNGTNYDRARSIINATNSTGTGIRAVGLIAQLDDTSPTTITENQFGNVRMSVRRSLLTQSEDKNSATYSASTNITPATSATDVFTITGNASTTVYVTKIRISGTQTTGGMVNVAAIKRSTADTGGTSSSVTAVPHDSNDVAGSATLLNYSANPTTGTAVGTVRQDAVPFSAATATTNNIVEWLFGQNGRPIVLRGTTQQLALNLGGVTITGGAINVDIEWFEV